jgi:hypothetical protein
MKSDVDFELLQEYLDGNDAAENDAAEEAFFARYDREIVVSEQLWAGIEDRIVPLPKSEVPWWLGIAAGLVLTIGLASLLLMPHKSETIAALQLPVILERPAIADKGPGIKPVKKPIHTDRIARKAADNPGVLSSDLGVDLDEQETAKHIEQTENLLRSIRNAPVSDTDDEVDVSYDKALSRRLLIENVVLRRDAEMKAKFPTKTLLADLEPFLIDIANLPDRAKSEDLRAIKQRVQQTEIVAALVDYQDRATDKR